jgi:tetratricopeptide (TPR) repeat protein
MRDYSSEKTRKILNCLKQIEQCEGLGSSSRRYRMLRYLVEAELEGRGLSIKAYSIGLDVLGRGSEFDPTSDSIVRVEIARLRDALSLYYLNNDVSEEIKISIPRGNYRPKFDFGSNKLKYLELDDSNTLGKTNFSISRKSTAVLILLLLVFGGFIVGIHNSNFLQEQIDRPILALSGNLESDSMAIIGEILAQYRNIYTIKKIDRTYFSASEIYRLEAKKSGTKDFGIQLLHVPTGQILMSGSFDEDKLNTTDYSGTSSPILLWIGRLAQLNGVLEKDYMSRRDFGQVFNCRYLAEVYFAQQTDQNHLEARTCFEEALADGQEYSSLYANLSLIYREEYSDQRNLLPGNPLRRAMNAARKAIEIDPYNAHAHYSLMTILFITGNTSEAIAAGDRAIALTSYDGEIVGGFAAQLNIAGYFEKALKMFELSIKLNPGLYRWRNYGIFLANLGNGELQKAGDASLALEGSHNPLYLAAMAIGYNRLGRTFEARDNYSQLMKLEPNIIDMYERRRYSPTLTRKLVSELRMVASTTMCGSPTSCAH